jgi:hypothetical protein
MATLARWSGTVGSLTEEAPSIPARRWATLPDAWAARFAEAGAALLGAPPS